MEFVHVSVLLKETIDGLNDQTGRHLCRWNAGRWRTDMPVKCAPDVSVTKGSIIGIDQDAAAIEAAGHPLKRLRRESHNSKK